VSFRLPVSRLNAAIVILFDKTKIKEVSEWSL